MKFSVIGCGKVGATIAFTAMLKNFAHEIVLVDVNSDKARGEMFDIMQCEAYEPQTLFHAGSYEDTAGSDVVIITAGIPRRHDEPRVLLLERNARLIADIVRQVVNYSPECILFMVTNPLDVMVQLAYEVSGFPASRVIGMGTVLDTARYRAFLSREFTVNARDIDAYVIGEHGETMVPVASNIKIKGISLEQFPAYSDKILTDIIDHVIATSGEVIALKGGTVFAPAVSACIVLEAIVHNASAILPVCTVNERYGAPLSLPTVIGKNGAGTVFDLALTKAEKERLDASVANIKTYVDELHSAIK
ncbi:malate dehydrogenase [Acetonema longum]|uniref:L-lactate dehydrogenase n=1 Tax=Acetonema longum DSM 6540 TaxID=1009370 RepID=F7NEE8_9FIRM|nr:malate dehydrogenase [Acetonema longum]EGO65359.1 hypothetical protein ALO_02056 [Acetonema longum DSM 6540]